MVVLLNYIVQVSHVKIAWPPNMTNRQYHDATKLRKKTILFIFNDKKITIGGKICLVLYLKILQMIE